YTCLQRAAPAPDARPPHMLQDPIWAFEEMLKFYPPNGRYPFPRAFFNHQASDYATLREHYPRHLPEEAANTANSRLRN
ncbi:MAG: hypothetical protein HQ592_16000, partial [Planctomycetes bacterium]|nr:hypothetical protein [Planctomycetota bacterium]